MDAIEGEPVTDSEDPGGMSGIPLTPTPIATTRNSEGTTFGLLLIGFVFGARGRGMGSEARAAPLIQRERSPALAFVRLAPALGKWTLSRLRARLPGGIGGAAAVGGDRRHGPALGKAAARRRATTAMTPDRKARGHPTGCVVLKPRRQPVDAIVMEAHPPYLPDSRES